MHNESNLAQAFEEISKSVAQYILRSLEKPLEDAIQNRVNEIINEATQDINNKILNAISHIQPIQIPINLLAQPFAQNVPGAPAPAAEEVAAPAASAEKAAMPHKAVAPPPSPTTAPPQKESPEIKETKAPQQATKIHEVQAKFADDSASSTSVIAEIKTKKLTIVGLKPGQAHMIKNEFKFAKISFIQASARNNKQLLDLGKGQNPIIFMTDFVRHASIDAAKSINSNWHYLSGGMTALREKIQTLLNEPSPA